MITAASSSSTLELVRSTARRHQRMYFPRFGGDFAVMDGADAGWQVHTPALAHELTHAFQIEDPRYIRAIPICYPNDPGMEKIGLATVTPPQWPPYVKLMERIERMTPARTFASANAMSYLAACRPALLRDFLDDLVVPMPKVYVGNLSKDFMETIVGSIDLRVGIPPRDAYLCIDEWYPKLVDGIEGLRKKGRCGVILAAGMSSRVVAKRLWRAETDVHLYDLGSWIDAVAGKSTRTWIKTARSNGIKFDGCQLKEASHGDQE